MATMFFSYFPTFGDIWSVGKKKPLGLFWLVVSQAWDSGLVPTCANPKHQMM
jgi:hypothetical protein